MTDQHQHRATPEQWALIESRRVSVYATSSCLVELRDRIQSLETHITPPAVDRVLALQDQIRDGSLTLPKALKEINGDDQPVMLLNRVARRVAHFACEGLPGNDATPIASAVLRDVAAWIDERELKAQNDPYCLEASTADEVVGWLRNEAAAHA